MRQTKIKWTEKFTDYNFFKTKQRKCKWFSKKGWHFKWLYFGHFSLGFFFVPNRTAYWTCFMFNPIYFSGWFYPTNNFFVMFERTYKNIFRLLHIIIIYVYIVCYVMLTHSYLMFYLQNAIFYNHSISILWSIHLDIM